MASSQPPDQPDTATGGTDGNSAWWVRWLSFVWRRIVRTLLAFVLGIMVVSGIGVLVVERTISTTLLDAGFYTNILAEHDAYNRLYDEVLPDPETRSMVEGDLTNAVGNVEIVTYDDIVMLLGSIAPPEYLREQTEKMIGNVVDYANGDTDRLEVYVNLAPALTLERVKPVLIAYVQRRIDEIREEPPESTLCSPAHLDELASGYVEVYREIAVGNAPPSLPSISVLSEPCRILLFEVAFGASEVAAFLPGDPMLERAGLDPRMVEGLQGRREEIRSAVVAGDTKGALKVAVPPLLSPVLDEGIGQFRAEFLDDSGRMDLIDQLTSGGQPDAAEFRADADEFRQTSLEWRSRARVMGVALVIGGSLLMFLIYLPEWNLGLRRLGALLTFVGAAGFIGVLFVGTRVLEGQLPRLLEYLLANRATGVEDFPPSLTALIGDLAGSAAGRLAQGPKEVFLAVLIMGAALLAASFIPILVRWLRSRRSEQLH